MRVEVLLVKEPTFSVDPAAEFGDPFSFDVDEDTVRDALNTAFAVCNSYPGELHSRAPRYSEAVDAYRFTGHRSLSVGDVVQVLDGPMWRGFICAPFGWDEIK